MIAIYSIDTGRIRMLISSPVSHIDAQCQDGETFFLGCPESATHVIDGVPVVELGPVEVAPNADILHRVRVQRSQLLSACDWTQAADAPLSESVRAAWGVYRQKLRDLPATCDLADVVWPLPPSG